MDGIREYMDFEVNPYLFREEVLPVDVPEAHITDSRIKHVMKHSLVSTGEHEVKHYKIEILPPEVKERNFNTTTVVKGLGMGNAVFGFFDLYNHVKRMMQATSRVDLEAKVEAMLRLFSLPLGIANGVEAIIVFFITLFESISIMALSLSALIFGSVFLTIELGLEIYRLIMINKFKGDLDGDEIREILSNLTPDLEKNEHVELSRINLYVIENQELIEKHLGEKGYATLFKLTQAGVNAGKGITKDISKRLTFARICLTERKVQKIYNDTFTLTEEDERWVYFNVKGKVRVDHEGRVFDSTDELTDKFVKDVLKGKADRLARRIGYSMVGKIREYHSVYLDVLSSKHPNLAEMEKFSLDMFNKVEEKTKKAMMVHFVGIGAILTGMILLAFSYISAPIFGIAVVGGLAFFLQTFRFLAPISYLDKDGRDFDLTPWKEKITKAIWPEKKYVTCIEMTTFSQSGVVENEEDTAYSERCGM